MAKEISREKIIVRTSIAGIITNILLSLTKAVVGFFSNSIAIILDSLNNLSDALSSIITVIGAKLALKPADKKHPFGHGRSEYLSALIISVIILYAGTTSLIESVKKITSPKTPEYNYISIALLILAVFVKIFLGLYVKKTGRRVNSTSLVASGQDALMDSIVSTSTVIAAAIFMITGKSFEAYIGLLISCLIIKSGIELVLETVSQILGERIESTLSREIKNTIISVDPEIKGAYDLILNNYGPNTYWGSVHIEVPASWDAVKIDGVTRKIQNRVFNDHNVMLTAVGIYSVNSKNSKIAQMKEKIEAVAKNYPDILQLHGFYVDTDSKMVRLDVVVSFDCQNRSECLLKYHKEISELFPEYQFALQLDNDMSD
ncbi:MAG: cation diffusion facilitator family transporter [Treponema sp.]|nr:cation diffusion facilitator family transporter [Treponema sp.]